MPGLPWSRRGNKRRIKHGRGSSDSFAIEVKMGSDSLIRSFKNERSHALHGHGWAVSERHKTNRAGNRTTQQPLVTIATVAAPAGTVETDLVKSEKQK